MYKIIPLNWWKLFSERAMYPNQEKSIAIEDVLDELAHFGYKKDENTLHPNHGEIKDLTHKMSRTIMRNVNGEVLQQLCNLHQMIKDEFINMPNKEIEWLMDGAPTARGSFINGASFKEFFNQDPSIITSSRLITAIDSVCSAIGYRVTNQHTAHSPSIPDENQNGFIMYQKVHEIFDGSLVPFIGETAYAMRDVDNVTDDSTKPDIYVVGVADDVSVVSDVEYEEQKLQEALDDKLYRANPDPTSEVRTWAAGAHDGNIPIRGHVSGTAPLSLSVIDKLYMRNQNNWIDNADHVRKLAGAVLIPSYERGDFHTVAETAAAVEYFLEARDKKEPQIYSPQRCLEIGLKCMSNAASGKVKELLENVSAHILSKTIDMPIIARPSIEEYISIIKHSTEANLLSKVMLKATNVIKLSCDESPQKMTALRELQQLLINKKGDFKSEPWAYAKAQKSIKNVAHEILKSDLESYINNRNTQKYSCVPLNALLERTIKSIKLDAANKLMELIDGNIDLELTRKNIHALKDGRLGKIYKEYLNILKINQPNLDANQTVSKYKKALSLFKEAREQKTVDELNSESLVSPKAR
ncbi:hypothetical protein [Legionella santicrucis]|nr:hypothetical protein [Legionella santicrucis]